MQAKVLFEKDDLEGYLDANTPEHKLYCVVDANSGRRYRSVVNYSTNTRKAEVAVFDQYGNPLVDQGMQILLAVLHLPNTKVVLRSNYDKVYPDDKLV